MMNILQQVVGYCPYIGHYRAGMSSGAEDAGIRAGSKYLKPQERTSLQGDFCRPVGGDWPRNLSAARISPPPFFRHEEMERALSRLDSFPPSGPVTRGRWEYWGVG